MTTEFIRIFAKNTVKDTLQFLQKNTDEETTYYLYVVDREDVLKGVVSLRDIVTSSFDTPIMDIVNPNVKTVLYSCLLYTSSFGQRIWALSSVRNS